ncbi:xaa-Pro aminopeptidase 1-like [Lytechinus pictus]|uniref:xaa-Pro aminopeptidase 1-like n=1 Tax=Lytechinus pictus TaxID=7653 RepID=UPI0030B9FC78
MASLKLQFVVFVAVAALLISNTHAGDRKIHTRRKRALLDVRNCDVNPPNYPPSTVISDVKLDRLRTEMRTNLFQYEAYIIPGYDAHGSEYPADPDRRLFFMSGFNGTGGFAIVTLEWGNAVWTEPQFELLAQQQLDCNWEIMILGDDDFLTPWEWLIRDDRTTDPDDINFIPGAGMPAGSQVGFDPRLMPYRDWFDLTDTNRRETRSMQFRTHDDEHNLVDITWEDLESEKDPYPGEKLEVQGDYIAGYTWRQKIFQEMPDQPNFKNVRQIMAERDCDLLVITGLDEIAWLFNLRGEDVPYNPLFISYAVVGFSYIYLYLYDTGVRLDKERYPEIRQHLDLDSQECAGSSRSTCIVAKGLSSFYYDLTVENNLVFSQKIWFSNSSSYFVYDAIMNKVNNDDRKYIMEPSPILLMKAIKNEQEVESMKEAMLIESSTMIEMVTWMQGLLEDMNNPKEGNAEVLTEYMAAERLQTIRTYQQSYMYPSYETISAFGPNSADYYYRPEENDRVPITTGQIFLYDIGAQYREGTTSLSRAFFFAKEVDLSRYYEVEEPTMLEKEIYTRVLLGHIDLCNASFRANVYGRDLDALARQHLWNVGLDYIHPTGYGLGQFLTVHEEPVNIGDYTLDETFHANMIISNGPGYYNIDPESTTDKDFGVRITNALQVVPSETPYGKDGEEYFEFEVISFVPFEPRLINFEMFTRKQLEWYNNYNTQIREQLDGKLSGNAREWMLSKTRFQKYDWEYIGGASSISMATTSILISICLIVAHFLSK